MSKTQSKQTNKCIVEILCLQEVEVPETILDKYLAEGGSREDQVWEYTEYSEPRQTDLRGVSGGRLEVTSSRVLEEIPPELPESSELQKFGTPGPRPPVLCTSVRTVTVGVS